MDWQRFKSARQTKTEAAPIRYWAELVGADTDTKEAPWSLLISNRSDFTKINRESEINR
jgi:hypothetical protein